MQEHVEILVAQSGCSYHLVKYVPSFPNYTYFYIYIYTNVDVYVSLQGSIPPLFCIIFHILFSVPVYLIWRQCYL